jgi:hypothetical protein
MVRMLRYRSVAISLVGGEAGVEAQDRALASLDLLRLVGVDQEGEGGAVVGPARSRARERSLGDPPRGVGERCGGNSAEALEKAGRRGHIRQPRASPYRS